MKKENVEFFSGIEAILSHRPSKLLWIVPLLIGSLIVFIILWLTLSQIDVIAPSQGKTIPSSRMILIQPKDISIIHKIHVKNGQRVQKGDLLIEFKDNIELFENSTMKAKFMNLLSEQLFLDAYINYIKNNSVVNIKDSRLNDEVVQRSNFKLTSNITSYKTEILSLEMKIQKIDYETKMIDTEIAKQTKLLPYTRYKLEQIKSLVTKGLESEITLKDLEKEFIEQEEDLKIKKAEKNKLSTELEITKKELEQFKNNTLKDTLKRYTEINNELKTLQPEVNKSDYLVASKSIRASENGFIYNLTNSNSGKVIQSGEIIMQLIPDNAPLEVETKVLNKDIGFVKVGQNVKVKLDSFKFTKYGYVEGSVTQIEKASVLDENLGEMYPVIVQLETDQMKIDDQMVKLMPGMTCSVDIKIGKRRLIDYIISPMIRYQDEALREK